MAGILQQKNMTKRHVFTSSKVCKHLPLIEVSLLKKKAISEVMIRKIFKKESFQYAKHEKWRSKVDEFRTVCRQLSPSKIVEKLHNISLEA
jgi:hypothetical protein